MFGTKSDRDIKELMPYVEKTNAEYSKLRNLSDEQLRQQTAELKEIIQKNLAKIDADISDLKMEIEANPEMSVDAKEAIFKSEISASIFAKFFWIISFNSAVC